MWPWPILILPWHLFPLLHELAEGRQFMGIAHAMSIDALDAARGGQGGKGNQKENRAQGRDHKKLEEKHTQEMLLFKLTETPYCYFPPIRMCRHHITWTVSSMCCCMLLYEDMKGKGGERMAVVG